MLHKVGLVRHAQTHHNKGSFGVKGILNFLHEVRVRLHACRHQTKQGSMHTPPELELLDTGRGWHGYIGVTVPSPVRIYGVIKNSLLGCPLIDDCYIIRLNCNSDCTKHKLQL